MKKRLIIEFILRKVPNILELKESDLFWRPFGDLCSLPFFPHLFQIFFFWSYFCLFFFPSLSRFLIHCKKLSFTLVRRNLKQLLSLIDVLRFKWRSFLSLAHPLIEINVFFNKRIAQNPKRSKNCFQKDAFTKNKDSSNSRPSTVRTKKIAGIRIICPLT